MASHERQILTQFNLQLERSRPQLEPLHSAAQKVNSLKAVQYSVHVVKIFDICCPMNSVGGE